MNSEISVVLGVDGGGTSTRCVAVDERTGSVLGSAEAGCSNKNSVGWENALLQLQEAIRAALQKACMDAMQVTAVGCGMSGCDSEADAEALRSAIEPWFRDGTKLLVANDAVAALCSGTNGVLDGCVVIAGTGMVAYGAVRGAARARAGGWGGAFLDGGSGYDVGQRALAAVARAVDGRGPSTALLHAVCARCGVADAGDPMPGLLRWAYAEENRAWAATAALADCVAACAAAGDTVAESILDTAAAELLNSLQAVCRRLELQTHAGAHEFTVVLAGGLLQPGSACAERLKWLCLQHLPSAKVVHAGDPALGAAQYAINALNYQQDHSDG